MHPVGRRCKPAAGTAHALLPVVPAVPAEAVVLGLPCCDPRCCRSSALTSGCGALWTDCGQLHAQPEVLVAPEDNFIILVLQHNVDPAK